VYSEECTGIIAKMSLGGRMACLSIQLFDQFEEAAQLTGKFSRNARFAKSVGWLSN
jgi:hypothetical protein